jgi:hypothetical protein
MRLIIAFSMLAVFTFNSPVDARSNRLIDGGSDATADALSTNPGGFIPPSNVALRIARSASSGVGSDVDYAYCYRAVKKIIADGLGKDLNCIRTILNDGSAKNAGKDLLELGFVLDMNKCDVPGTARVYSGRPVKGRRNTAGTYHGDIQIVGDDGMYHHFWAESRPSNVRNPEGRVLTGCYVPDANKIASGPAAKCPATAYKTLKTKSVSPKSKAGQGVD